MIDHKIKINKLFSLSKRGLMICLMLTLVLYMNLPKRKKTHLIKVILFYYI